MASVKAIMAKLLNCDYVIEEGTSGDWTYRKWKSGIAECWAGYSVGSFAPTGSFGGTYYRILDKAFPMGLFDKTPAFAEVDAYWDTGNSWASARSVSKDTIQYSVFKNSNSSYSAAIRIYAIGTWKSDGGGYCLKALSAIFSRLARGWEHAEFQVIACKDTRRPAAIRYEPHNHRWYWHLLGHQSDYSKFCINGLFADNILDNRWHGLCGKLHVLGERYVCSANRISAKVHKLHKSICEGFNQHGTEWILFELGNDRQSVNTTVLQIGGGGVSNDNSETARTDPIEIVCDRHRLHSIVDGNINKRKQCESYKQNDSSERHLYICAEMPSVQSGSVTCICSRSIWKYERRNVPKRTIGYNNSSNTITTDRGCRRNGYEPSHDIHVYRKRILKGNPHRITPERGCAA